MQEMTGAGMQWNMEPMGGVDPQSVPPGMPPIPLAAYGQRLLELGQQAGGAAAQGLQQLQQMRPEDVLTPEVLGAKEAQKQLRMERARQSYERNFGSPFQGQAANQSLASQGKQDDIDALLRRVHIARQMGYRPGRGS
jgi:hypothetical protein